jgi:hypothetical protein
MGLEMDGSIGPSGDLELKVLRADGSIERPVLWTPDGPPPPPETARELTMAEIIRLGLPQVGLPAIVNLWRRANTPKLLRQAGRLALARRLGLPHFHGALYLRKLCANGDVVDYGLAGLRLVTNAGAGFIVDAFQNLVELENMKFHGIGTGSTAEAAGDTALVTELTTQYNPDNTRATGSLEEASAQVFRTIGTVTPDSGHPISLREHGVLSQAATGGGVLLDRTVYALITLDTNGDALQATYTFTVNSGS